jgi:putative transcriptional regulator
MINYKPLFKTMSKKQISSYALFKKTFPNQLIIQYNRETNTIDQLCRLLECPVSDILEYKDEKE